MNIAVIFIGTRRFRGLYPLFRGSLGEHFLPDHQRAFFVLTDEPEDPVFENPCPDLIVRIDHLPWPLVTLMRFHWMSQLSDKLVGYDWVFYLDSDMVGRGRVAATEFLPDDKDFVSVLHPGFYRRYHGYQRQLEYLHADGILLRQIRRRLVRSYWDSRDYLFNRDHYHLHHYAPPFENNSLSRAFIGRTGILPPYRAGGIWGGRGPVFHELLSTCSDAVNDDLSRNLIARYHDESHINRFFHDHADRTATLDSSYCYPENGNLDLPVRLLHADKWTPAWLASEEMRYRTK